MQILQLEERQELSMKKKIEQIFYISVDNINKLTYNEDICNFIEVTTYSAHLRCLYIKVLNLRVS